MKTPRMVKRAGSWFASAKEYRDAVAWAAQWPVGLPLECDNVDHLRNFYNESRAQKFQTEMCRGLVKLRLVRMTADFGGTKQRWCQACCQNDADMIEEMR